MEIGIDSFAAASIENENNTAENLPLPSKII